MSSVLIDTIRYWCLNTQNRFWIPTNAKYWYFQCTRETRLVSHEKQETSRKTVVTYFWAAQYCTFSPRASFKFSTSLVNCSIGSLKRLDPIMSSKYSSMPSSCSDCAFGFIMDICSTSPWWQKHGRTNYKSLGYYFIKDWQ